MHHPLTPLSIALARIGFRSPVVATYRFMSLFAYFHSGGPLITVPPPTPVAKDRP